MNDTSQCFLIFQSQRQTSSDQSNQVKSSGLAQRYAFTSPRNCWSFEVDLNLYADLFQLDKSYSAVFVCGPISCGLTVLFPGRTVERTGKKVVYRTDRSSLSRQSEVVWQENQFDCGARAGYQQHSETTWWHRAAVVVVVVSSSTTVCLLKSRAANFLAISGFNESDFLCLCWKKKKSEDEKLYKRASFLREVRFLGVEQIYKIC